ncbi:DUF4254 domain-containing protein [Nocardia sp. NPDC052001]|uniref:DUF4254 domain-containing protein n=1 Tax=Nocardia sp. NPDC052001 TaxID=3154853 RepID=UPI003444B267
MTHLPSKDLILEACSGHVHEPHPILLAAYELASLHEARPTLDYPAADEIDCCRSQLIHDIDVWVAQTLPATLAAPSMHTETIGTVVDRLAELSVVAFTALRTNTTNQELHRAWQCLAELALGYNDLTHDLMTGRRRLPTPKPNEETQ